MKKIECRQEYFRVDIDEKCYLVAKKVYYMIIRRYIYMKQVISKKSGMIKIVSLTYQLIFKNIAKRCPYSVVL